MLYYLVMNLVFRNQSGYPVREQAKPTCGIYYRSPSSEAANNLQLALTEMLIPALARNPTHCLIVGDFNYNTIDWNLGIGKGAAAKASGEWKFLKTLKDLYLYRHCRQ